jgi:hypothetical protein
MFALLRRIFQIDPPRKPRKRLTWTIPESKLNRKYITVNINTNKENVTWEIKQKSTFDGLLAKGIAGSIFEATLDAEEALEELLEYHSKPVTEHLYIDSENIKKVPSYLLREELNRRSVLRGDKDYRS